PADWNLHLLQVAIRLGQKTSAVSDAEPPERSLPDPETLARMYRDVPEALVESLRVAEACNLDLLAVQKPSVGDESESTAANRLDQWCRQRFDEGRQRKQWHDSAYEQRLETELATLRRLKFSRYFLVAGQIADQARREG